MNDSGRTRLRELSHAAFGQQYRLEVMLAAAHSPDGLVCLTDVARELGLSISNVQGSLKSLVTVGLLEEMPAGDSRRKFYLRNPSAAWDWAEQMSQQVGAESSSRPHGSDIDDSLPG